MNPYKLRSILAMIRDRGKLPQDQWGEILEPDDLLVWFELMDRLTPDEREEVKRELGLMAEAENFMASFACRHI